MSHQVKKKLGVTLHSGEAEFRVWAPFATNVRLLVPFLGVYDGSNTHDMLNEGDGYWSAFVEAEAGQSYKFLIDTGRELLQRNDPRGRIITSSENGVSVVAATDFDWGDDLFMPIPKAEQIIYELHIGTFNRKDPATGGTFYDAIEKLDYLKELGVNMIELMPVTSMTYSNGWGYNTSDIFSIETAYGGRHGLMEFVKACHARGIGVIIDVVYNHFMSSDLWRFDGWYENDRGGIYFYNDERGETPWGARPDYGRPEVRQFLIDNVVMWFSEFRVDGLRLDSTAYMRNTKGYNDDPPHDIGDAWSLMQEISTTAHKVRPGAVVIAEDVSTNEFITRPHMDGGCGFDAQWGIVFPHAIRQLLGLNTGEPVDFLTELYHYYNGHAFEKIIFSDSHDTAANGSSRITAAITPAHPGSVLARKRLLLASAITLTSPGIPMLLQGQEFMQEGAFNDWQMLEWEKTKQFSGIVTAHQHLIALRRNLTAQTGGLMGESVALFHRDEHNNIIGYHRWDTGGQGDDTLIIANFNRDSFAEYRLRLPLCGTWKVRFNSSWTGYSPDFEDEKIETITTDDTGIATLPIPGYGVYILSQE